MLASGSASTEMPALVVSSRASTSTQTQGSTASPARTSTQTAGDTSTLASTSTQTQKTSTQSEGRQTRNPEQTVNPPTKISQTIKSLRRNHPGMSGRTMLMAASTQVDIKSNIWLALCFYPSRVTHLKANLHPNHPHTILIENHENRLTQATSMTLTTKTLTMNSHPD
jgi:hypothetical protein